MEMDTIFTSLDTLDISRRDRKILRILQIQNLMALLHYETEEIEKQLHANALSEYTDTFMAFFTQLKKDVYYPELYFRNNDGIQCYDLDIKYIAYATRARHMLANFHIQYISEVLALDENTVRNDFGITGKTADEILMSIPILRQFISDRVVANVDSDPMHQFFLHIIKELKGKCDFNGARLFDSLLEYADKLMDFDFSSLEHLFADEKLFLTLFDVQMVQEILADSVVSFIKKNTQGASYNDISSYMPSGFAFDSIVNKLIITLLQNETIYLEDAVYMYNYISIINYLHTLKKASHEAIVLERLQGRTLESVGITFGRTRERIRQIILKAMSNRPMVKEDRYAYLYTHYYIDKTMFLTVFHEQPFVYTYLSICYKRGKRKIEECLLDPNLLKKDQQCLEKEIHKNDFLVGDTYRKPKRHDICNYILRTYGTQEITFDHFFHLYYDMLDRLGLCGDPRFAMNKRGYQNKIAAQPNVLYKYNQRFRYYNTEAYDFSELLSTINLQQYKDVEISTLLWFHKYPKLMHTYDIRDEYELHNLLKKILHTSIQNITFHRMPIIEFGKADRQKQVYELLVEHAPIRNIDLAKKYEEKYGVATNTALSNYFKHIMLYFDNGIYTFNNPVPDDDVLHQLEAILTKDFYFMSDCNEIIMQHCPKLDTKYLNPYVLRKIGYKPYNNFILKSTYISAAEYFRHILTEDQCIDLHALPKSLLNLPGFHSELTQLKANYDIVEYRPTKYINYTKLQEYRIQKADLHTYCDFVFAHTEENEYFTIHSLLRNGIKADLNMLAFEEWFYASILAECKSSFQSIKAGNNKLFRKGRKLISLSNFIMDVLLKMDGDCITLQDVTQLLKEEYNIQFKKTRMVEVIKQIPFHYDSIQHTIHKSESPYPT